MTRSISTFYIIHFACRWIVGESNCSPSKSGELCYSIPLSFPLLVSRSIFKWIPQRLIKLPFRLSRWVHLSSISGEDRHYYIVTGWTGSRPWVFSLYDVRKQASILLLLHRKAQLSFSVSLSLLFSLFTAKCFSLESPTSGPAQRPSK